MRFVFCFNGSVRSETVMRPAGTPIPVVPGYRSLERQGRIAMSDAVALQLIAVAYRVVVVLVGFGFCVLGYRLFSQLGYAEGRANKASGRGSGPGSTVEVRATS